MPAAAKKLSTKVAAVLKIGATMLLDCDHRFVLEHDGITHIVFRDGSGPAVLVMHEAPGMSERCLALADRLIGA